MSTPPPADTLSGVKLALLARQLRGKIEGAELLHAEPVALIGMGCRFPGGADSPAAFWELLARGGDAIREVPPERWDADAYYDPDPRAPMKMATRWGGFLEQVDRFDADFFGIAPREAAHMDPQQRLLLEVAWEALEDAGLPQERLAGAAAGVFVGVCSSDYSGLQFADAANIDAYSGSGSASAMVANRLSYLLGLQGPSLALDTACSSSLVALHLACVSLRLGECDLALAGGVNLILSPEVTISFSKANMLAPDGRCKTFDARANGYVRGEGCGVVVLKRLSDALQDGDRILAIVRGSAVNQDGRSNGLTAPNLLAQQAVLRQALTSAKIQPHEVGYVEAHGTGTPLGDPIEVEALGAVLGRAAPGAPACALGSVKTNIGHLEGAAGIAGVIKVILALQHGAIPPHLHLERLNPHISLEGTRFSIPTALTPWPAGAARRFAGVSSFGFGGTNAHVLIEEPPALPAPPAAPAQGALLLALSARSPEALRALAQRYRGWLADPRGGAGLAARALAFSAATRRSHHPHRLALVGADQAELGARLDDALRGERHPGLVWGKTLGERPGLVFVFCGQGPQWAGMGQELYATQPVFRDALDRCAELIRGELGADIRPLMFGADEGRTTKDEEASGVDRTTGVADAGLRPDDGRTTEDEGASRVDRTTGVADAGLRPDDGRTTKDEGASGVDRTTGVADAGLRPDDGRTTEDEGTSGVDRTTGVADAGLRPSSSVLGPETGLRPSSSVLGPETGLRPSSSVLGPETGLRPSSSVLGPALERTEVAQPALFALQVALLEQLRAWGLAPDAVLGHSVGEVAAAYAAGALSLEDAVRVVCRRGLAMAPAAGLGRMLSVELAAAEAERLLAEHPGVSVAALNGPRSLVLAGAPDALERLAAALAQRGVAARALRGGYAFHSPQMAPFQAGLVQALAGLAPRPARLPIASSVTGRLAPAGLFDAAYWGRNMREPVRFAEAAAALIAAGHATFLEIGPHPVLGGALAQLLEQAGQSGPPLATLRRGRPDATALLEGLAGLYAQGHAPDWRALFGRAERAVPLPTYPWQRARFWLAGAPDLAARSRAAAPPAPDGHPLLGRRLRSPLARAAFEAAVGAAAPAYLADHRVYDTLLFPAAAYLELGLAAAAELGLPGALEQVLLHEAMPIAPEAARLLQLTVDAGQDGQRFQIFSQPAGAAPDEPWRLHASGRFAAAAAPPAPLDLAAALARCPLALAPADYYAAYRARGFDYGPTFQTLTQIHRGAGLALGRLALPDTAAAHAGRHQLHPALLDGCAQLVGAALSAGAADAEPDGYLPVGLERLALFGRPDGPLWCLAELRGPTGAEVLTADLGVFDADGRPVAALAGFAFKRTPRAALRRLLGARRADWRYELVWQPAAPAAPPAPGGPWLIIPDAGGLGAALAARLDGAALAPADLLDPGRPDGLERLLEGLPPCDPAAPPRVLFLGGLDAAAPPEGVLPALDGALRLLQQLARAARPARLWLVTRGAQPVAGGPVAAPEQAPLWGLGRVAAAEHPELWGGLIDLAPGAADPAGRLAALLGQLDGEDQIGLRGGRRYAARLARAQAEQPAPPPLQPDASYLISGGLGALGLRVARWLAERGARSLVLVGRSAPSEAAARAVAAIEQTGARVRVLAADLADPDAAARLVARLDAELPPLRGVVHAAGVLDDGVLLQQSAARFERVLAPKVQGAWNLDRLTRAHRLDFFVCFSSAAAALGNPGQSGYAAANAFLDALMARRQAEGLPGLSIAWGPWAEAGMAAGLDQRWAARGVTPIGERLGLEALELLLGRSGYALVLPVEWAAFGAALPPGAAPPLLAGLIDAARPGASAAGPDLPAMLESAPPEQRWELLTTQVRQTVARVLGRAADQELEPRQGFFDMGLDSLMAVELRGRLQQRLGRALPTTLVFDYPTLETLCRYLGAQVLGLAEPAAAPVAQDRGLLAAIRQLSDDQAEAQLAQELKELADLID